MTRLPVAIPLCAALVLATGIAQAGNDPLPGTWTAPPSKSDLAMGLGGTTLTITAAPGGYTFKSVAHGKDGDMAATMPTIPDGKPHAGTTTFGPVTATCHRTDPRTLSCDVGMGPMPPSRSVFALSADGKTLTETDTEASTRVEYSASTSVTETDGKVTRGPASSSSHTSQATTTTVTVYHRQ